MSFASELSTIMNGITNLSTSVDGGVYRDTTATEFNAKKTWVIYTFKRGFSMPVLVDKDAIKKYTLYVEVYTSNAATTETLSDLIRDYLTPYTTTTFRDITFINETHTNVSDTNNNVAYITLLEFEVLYDSV